MKKHFLIFLFFIFLLPTVSAHYWDFVTIGQGDNRWCQLLGTCEITNLKVKNLTIENGTVNFINKTVINLTVIGEIDIEGNINAENGTFNELNVSRITTTNLQATDTINSSQSLDSSLVLDLKLNGNVNDSSQYENHGTNDGTILSRDVGDLGGVNDFVEVPSTMNFPLGANAKTVAIWVKLNVQNPSAIQFITSTGDNGVGEQFAFTYDNNNQQKFQIRTFGGGDNTINSIDSGQVNRWYHLAATYDGNDLEFYVDGTSNGKTTPTTIDTQDNSFFIGQATTGVRNFNGSIACVKIYNRALSLGEITEEMSQCDAVTNYEHFNNIQTNEINISTELTNQGESNFLDTINIPDNVKTLVGSAGDVSKEFNETDYVVTAEVGTPRFIWNGLFCLDTATGFVGIGNCNPLSILHLGGTTGDTLMSISGGNNFERGINFYLGDLTTLRGYMKWDSGENLNLKGDIIIIDVQNTDDAVIIDGDGNQNLIGNFTLGDKITFRLGGIIDNIKQDIINITINLLGITGNVTAENVFLPQFIFPHTNITLPVRGANLWTNVTFDQEVTSIKQGIGHTSTDGTNTTFTINAEGIYDISFDFDIIDTSAGASDVDVAGRLIFINGTEIDGSLFETDIIKQQVEVELSHNFMAELIEGDRVIFQFIADDVDVEISTHSTFGEHPDSASVVIKKHANIPRR